MIESKNIVSYDEIISNKKNGNLNIIVIILINRCLTLSFRQTLQKLILWRNSHPVLNSFKFETKYIYKLILIKYYGI